MSIAKLLCLGVEKVVAVGCATGRRGGSCHRESQSAWVWKTPLKLIPVTLLVLDTP